MSKRPFDPRRLDVAAFADAAAEVSGQWPLTALPRLAEMTCRDSGVDADPMLDWNIRGEKRKLAGASVRPWLHLDARVRLAMLCQRCLLPVVLDVDARRSFAFVEGDAEAAELDAECEDDVLALVRELDSRELVEDELLLSLPLIPKHESCDPPQTQGSPGTTQQHESPHPFAALAALRRGTDPA
jgi:uncharacterized protein